MYAMSLNLQKLAVLVEYDNTVLLGEKKTFVKNICSVQNSS